MMKQLTWAIIIFFLFSCGNKKNKTVLQSDTIKVVALDSISSLARDVSILNFETVTPESVHMDKSFEDFAFHFATNNKFQKERIVFPLLYCNGDPPLKIDKSEWDHDSIFYNSNYYTLFADSESDLEFVEDTSRTSVQVECVFMEKSQVKCYCFKRKDGRWMLEGIDAHPLDEKRTNDFTSFFIHFATDSVYQANHLRNPLIFITIDPDDDFSILETTLDAQQWFAFKPLLPKVKFSNINYGQKYQDNSRQKVVQLKGIGNGFLNTLFFRKRKGEWELYKFEDTSN